MQDPNIPLTQELVKLVAEIDEFKGRWEALKHLSPERLHKLRKVATIESIGSSTRIEGARLTDFQVETLLSNLSTTSFKTRDEQEVAGYAEAMDIVFQAHEELRITENHIRQLHQTLLRHSEKDARHRGDYKKLPNHVVALDGNGKEIGVIFETTLPFDTPREMEALVHWTNKSIDENSLHPLFIIAVFIVVFLAIHPFQDGNGRLSRILTTLMLLRAGYDYVPYSSLENVIEENKDLYYKALRRTQSSLKTHAPDWEPWLGFFLRCLKKQKTNLAVRIAHEHSEMQTEEPSPSSGNADLPSLSLQVLGLLEQHGRLSISELAMHSGANQNTLKLRLRELLASGHIARFGKARATWYALNERKPRD